MTNRQSFKARIDKVATLEQLDTLEKSLDRLWSNGVLTQSEFTRLDLLIFDKKVSLSQ